MNEYTGRGTRPEQVRKDIRDLKITWFTAGVVAGVVYMLLVVLVCTRIY